MSDNPLEKERLRKKLSRDMKAFLKSGGKITECPPRTDLKLEKKKGWFSRLTWSIRQDKNNNEKE